MRYRTRNVKPASAVTGCICRSVLCDHGCAGESAHPGVSAVFAVGDRRTDRRGQIRYLDANRARLSVFMANRAYGGRGVDTDRRVLLRVGACGKRRAPGGRRFLQCDPGWFGADHPEQWIDHTVCGRGERRQSAGGGRTGWLNFARPNNLFGLADGVSAPHVNLTDLCRIHYSVSYYYGKPQLESFHNYCFYSL